VNDTGDPLAADHRYPLKSASLWTKTSSATRRGPIPTMAVGVGPRGIPLHRPIKRM